MQINLIVRLLYFSGCSQPFVGGQNSNKNNDQTRASQIHQIRDLNICRLRFNVLMPEVKTISSNTPLGWQLLRCKSGVRSGERQEKGGSPAADPLGSVALATASGR